MTKVARLRLGAGLLAGVLALGACAGNSPRETVAKTQPAPAPSSPEPSPAPSPDMNLEGLLLSSSFEEPVCGRWSQQPEKHGCEFGVQGGATAGPYEPRTGEWAVRIPRMTPSHQGVIADVPLENGHAFVGLAHRIPSIPAGAIPASPGHIQLEQLSPTDGVLPGRPVEVRLYPDRRLGLALFGDSHQVVMADWRVPVDRWFYVVVEIANGKRARQSMWLYSARGDLKSEVSTLIDTTSSRGARTAHKVGGNTSTLAPMYTYADDWYISESSLGPVRIDEQGRPLSP